MFSMATNNLFTYYASLTTAWMMFRSVATEIIPEPYRTSMFTFFENLLKKIFGRFIHSKPSTHMTIVIHEQSGITRNQIFEAAQLYLRTKINPNTERLMANKTAKQKSISMSMEKTQTIFDRFKDFEVKWQFVSVKEENREEEIYYEITFEKIYKETVVNEYLPFVLEKAKEIKDGKREVKLYTQDCSSYDDDSYNGGNYGVGGWGCITLDHPVTFDKLAMDPSLKKSIMDDLDRFVRRKDYYKKVGKAWKRGYLLYGPPGTGKSSLIAAMANYLRFDVYDLELSNIYDNSALRRMLLGINNRSIIIIEDIDCNSQTHDREDEGYVEPEDDNTRLTLSGLLNFIDGLWSTCGDERIIIFTTNHKDKLDPALLRPGRMDMHIYMGYCTVEGFEVLAYNYLGINDHPELFPEIKELIKEVEITPAELAEHLMRDEDVDLALEGVIGLLKQKKDVQTVMPLPEIVEKSIIDAESEEINDMKKDGKKSIKHRNRSKGKKKRNH